MSWVISFFRFIFFLFLVSGPSYASEPALTSTRSTSRQQIKILNLNVGGADFNLSISEGLRPVCDAFKLCQPDMIDRVRRHIARHRPDVIHLQEVYDLAQLTRGNGKHLPILPLNYQAACGFGASRLREVCLAWNSEKVKSLGLCKTIFGREGGAIRCSLQVGADEIDFISIHPSAWYKGDQEAVIKATWSRLVRNERPTIIAGDFNTFEKTYLNSALDPYPPNFGTVFGRLKQNYGRWAPPRDGFGKFIPGAKEELQIETYKGTTIFGDKVDHIFANFGEPASVPESGVMPCGQVVCVGNQEGYEWGGASWSFLSSWGPKTDHLPILALITWNSPVKESDRDAQF